MSIQELIEAAKNTVVGEQQIEDLQGRLKAAEQEFEEQSRSKSVNQEFFSRTYSL